jgi:hypothetical protein
MKVQDRTFTNLLSHRKVFAIPAFQRRYAWKNNNFMQLWEDIKEVIDGSRKRHFMGTVVFQPDGTNLSVIDGQQRLATFTIMLKVLHDLSNEYAPLKKKTIEKLLTLKGQSFLIPSLYDRPAFATLLDNPILLKKSEHKCIKDCYDFFLTEIRGYITTVKGQNPAKFSKILDALVEKMVFVEILLADDDDTHAIFETINYAGVPLTSADLARNFVLSQAKNDTEQDRLNKIYWQPLEEKLMGSLIGNGKVRKAELQKVLPEFLRAVLVVEKKKYISSTDLFRELRAYFRSGNIEEKLQTLLMHATEYCKFLNPSLEERAKSVRPQLLRLLDLRMTTYNPVLLILFRSNVNGGVKTNELVRAMQYIESFIVRRSFNTKVSRDLPKVFAKIASSLGAEKRGDRLLPLLSRMLKEARWPDDAVFRPCFLSTPIYTNAPATARFALLSLERHNKKTNENEQNLDSKIQIEHVFPKSPKQEDWDSKEIPDLKKRLHVMGNLTLTQNNQSLSNNGFNEKKTGKNGYKKSTYWLTKTLVNFKSWTKVEIDKRGERLLREALKIWPYP